MSSLSHEADQLAAEREAAKQASAERIKNRREGALEPVEELEKHLEPLLNEIRSEGASVMVCYWADTHFAEWFKFPGYPFPEIYSEYPMFYEDTRYVGIRSGSRYTSLWDEKIYEKAVALTFRIETNSSRMLKISFIPFVQGFFAREQVFHYEGKFYNQNSHTTEWDDEKYLPSDSGNCATMADCEDVLRMLLVRLLAKK